MGAEEDECESCDQDLHVDDELVDAGRLEAPRRLRDDDGVRLRALDLVLLALCQATLEASLVQFGYGAVMVPRGVGCAVLLVASGTVCV